MDTDNKETEVTEPTAELRAFEASVHSLPKTVFVNENVAAALTCMSDDNDAMLCVECAENVPNAMECQYTMSYTIRISLQYQHTQ